MHIFFNVFIYSAIIALVFLGGETARQVSAVNNFESAEVGVQELSPKGAEGGIAVPASGGSAPTPPTIAQVCENQSSVRVTASGGHQIVSMTIEGQNVGIDAEGKVVAGSSVVVPERSTNPTIEYSYTAESFALTRVGRDEIMRRTVTTHNASEQTISCVPPTPVPPTCVLNITPASLPAGGGTATFAWSSTNATSLSLDGTPMLHVNNPGSPLNVYASKTYVATVTGPGGTATCSDSITVANAPTPPTCTFTITPNTLPAGGGNTTFAWSSTNATSLRIDGTPMGNVNNPGSPLMIYASGVFTVYATGPGGTVACPASVTVANTPIPPPTATIHARSNGGPWIAGQLTMSQPSPDIDIQWGSTNATSCVGTEFTVAPAGAVSGTQLTVSAPANNSSKLYRVTCTGPGGTASATVGVTILNYTPPSATIEVRSNSGSWTGNNITVNEGADLDLRWSSVEAFNCIGTQFTVTPAGAAAGTQTSVTAPSAGQSRSYTVSCTAMAGGTVSDSVTVTAIGAPPTATIEIRNNDITPLEWTGGNINISSGDDLDLRWSSTNATTCSGGSTFTVTPAGATSGTQPTVTAPTINQTRTYTVTCTGSGGSATDSVSATMPSLPPTITANPTVVRIGETTIIRWGTGSAPPASCSVTGPGLGTTYTPLTAPQGTFTPTLEAESTFTITCPTGTDSVTVKVLPRIQET